MKKLLASFILVTAFLCAGGVAYAQAAPKTVPVAVTPANHPFLYNLKIALESMKQALLHVVSSKAEAAYLRKRVAERDAEIHQMEDDYQAYVETQLKNGRQPEVFDQGKYLVATNLKADEWELIASRAKPGDDPAVLRQVPTAYVDLNGTIRRTMEDRLAKLRQDLVEAHAAGDDAKTTDLLAQLKDAQQAYLQELDVAARSAATAQTLWDRFVATLKLLPDQEVIAAGNRAEAIKKQVMDQEEKLGVPAALRTNFDDLDKKIAAAKEEAAKPDARKLSIPDLFKALSKKPAESHQTLKNDAEQKKLPEEKPAAVQTPPASPASPPANPTAPKPKLKTIPSNGVATKPLVLNYYKQLTALAGTSFSAQYSGSDGLPPYHFQLATGVGFPPHGLILDTNGLLSGTPSGSGTFTFGVCVVDTAGISVCENSVMTVVPAAPAPEPAPAPQVDCSNFTKIPDDCTNPCYAPYTACLDALESGDLSDSEYYHQRDLCDAGQCTCINDCMVKRTDGWASCWMPKDCSKMIVH